MKTSSKMFMFQAAEPAPEEIAEIANAFFGPDGRHASDCSYLYNNIRDNVAKRVAAYLENTK